MKKVKIKGLELLEYAAKKPVTIAADGKKATLADACTNHEYRNAKRPTASSMQPLQSRAIVTC